MHFYFIIHAQLKFSDLNGSAYLGYIFLRKTFIIYQCKSLSYMVTFMIILKHFINPTSLVWFFDTCESFKV